MKSYIKEEEVTSELKAMMSDGSYHITPGYSIDTETYPDHIVPFIEAHLNYLKSHHQVDPEHYLANLRLMLKIR